MNLTLKSIVPVIFFCLSVFASSVSAADKTGMFVPGPEGTEVSGSVTLTDNAVILGNDFHTIQGPDLHIYVSDSNKPETLVAVLKNDDGKQTYKLPKGLKSDSIKSVFVYCQRYSVIFGVAKVK